MATSEEKLQSLYQEVNDHSTWIAAHDARGDALWEEQRRVNSEYKEFMEFIREKLDKMQVKLSYVVGFTALIGTILGTLVAKVF